jgi:hypothetical protein
VGWARLEIHSEFWCGNLLKAGHVEDSKINGSTIKLDLREIDLGMRDAWNCSG